MKHPSAKRAAPAKSDLSSVRDFMASALAGGIHDANWQHYDKVLEAAISSHAGLVGALTGLVTEADKTGGRERTVSRYAVDKARAALKAANAGQPVGPDYSGLIAAAIAVAESADPEGGDPNDPDNEESVPSIRLNALSAELVKLHKLGRA